MKIPIILHESDAVMGRANRLIAKMATHVCLGFPQKRSIEKLVGSNYSLLTSHCSCTGNPLRKEITQGSREEGLKITGFSGTRPILLIMGGSQGAQVINEWTVRHLTQLTAICDVIHLRGPNKAPTSNQQPVTRNYWTTDFSHTELPHLYACSDMAVSRAGAGSIAELSGNGIPSILIPLRGVAHDHQVFNAKSLQERGAALLVTQNEMDKELMNVLKQLIHDPAAREMLRSKIREFCIGDSTGQIVNVISRTLAGKQAA
jgi:UDP-N-acetylglucosamine--N-acetylmuramyl-(pentapeptide) pyrophosphoryl-undecaprenol N-acetylglucosamine transferase